jgi:voltage-gated potassium channel
MAQDAAGQDKRRALGPERAPRRRRAPHIQQRSKGRAERAIAGRHVFRYLAVVTVVLSVAAGVLVWLIDRRDFATLGDGLWWALQTLSTVGYGDVVPHTAWGRVVGSVVIVLGVTFLSFLTATITSYFVTANQEERAADVEALRGADVDDTQALLREVLQRLESIEQALRDGPADGPSR